MSKLWFVSDMHFGHANIIKYCQRPFESVEEMDQSLVDRWNQVVAAEDTVYCLGDMAFHNYHRIGELKGRKHLVPGNHDHEREKKVYPYFETVMDELSYIKVEGVKVVLCHYPLESWKRDCRIHLHGHSHGESRKVKWRMDVGVDATRLYRPLSWSELMSRVSDDVSAS